MQDRAFRGFKEDNTPATAVAALKWPESDNAPVTRGAWNGRNWSKRGSVSYSVKKEIRR